MISMGLLHYTIIEHIIGKGYAPDLKTISTLLKNDVPTIQKALYELQNDHGVVLHPDKPAVWVIHPFSTAPSNFLVKSSRGIWWGNCAWCSMGVAALLKEDLTITTRLGAYDEPIVIHIVNGEKEQILAWSGRHNIPTGDIQTLDNVWAFSKKWYGNHLNPRWEKWTMQEARDIFKEFNLTDKIWDLEKSGERF